MPSIRRRTEIAAETRSGSKAAPVTFTLSGTARSALQRFLADNFFTYRFDYRREWIKSIEILSVGPDHVAVHTRVITAVANIADSPAGLLWVRDLDGSAYQWAGSWNHSAVAAAELAESPFIALFRGGTWIIELD